MEEKIDIYSLFNYEQKVKLEDDIGRSMEIIMVKLTQGERRKIIDVYSEKLIDERKKIEEREKKSGVYTRSILVLTKDQLVDRIIGWEKTYREGILDLFPIENEEKLSQEERIKKQNEELDKWIIQRREDLSKENIEKLRENFLNMTIENAATLEAAHYMDMAYLAFACKDPVTYEPIFKTSEDVERVKDRRILDKLLEVMREMRKFESESAIRKVSENPDFQQSG